MTTYLISKGNWEQPRNFNTIEEAEAWALANVGAGCSVTIAGPNDQIKAKTAVQILTARQAFGSQLQQTFVLDNAPFQPTKSQAKQLLSKLRDAWELCELGSLQLCSEELTDTQTDAIFTAERKAKYLLMISNFLASE